MCSALAYIFARICPLPCLAEGCGLVAGGRGGVSGKQSAPPRRPEARAGADRGVGRVARGGRAPALPAPPERGARNRQGNRLKTQELQPQPWQACTGRDRGRSELLYV